MKKKIYFIIFLSFFIIALNCIKSLGANIPKVYIEGDIRNMSTKKDERKVLLKYKTALKRQIRSDTGKNTNFKPLNFYFLGLKIV